MSLDVFTLRERPELREAIFSAAFRAPLWPEFTRHDRVAQFYYGSPYFDAYQDYAFAAVENGAVVGRAFSVPVAFGIPGRAELPDGGWDEVIRWAHDDRVAGHDATAVSALEITVVAQGRGRGCSRVMLDAMRRNTRARGFADLFAPVRPTEKARCPFMAMQDYVAAVQPDGLPQDPWLRTHVRAGGTIIKIASCSMVIAGTLAEWRAWTGLRFEKSGPIALEGGLVPLHVSVEQDHAVYVEPNVWVHHRV